MVLILGAILGTLLAGLLILAFCVITGYLEARRQYDDTSGDVDEFEEF